MIQKIYNKAIELDSEINRLDILINYVNEITEGDTLMNSKHSDFAYLVELIGVNNALGYMRRRKKC